MSEFSVVIPASAFLCQRIAGLSGVAREVILADLCGATRILLLSSRPMAADWRDSFAVRQVPLPDVATIARMDDIPADAGRLVVLPEDRLLTRRGMERLVSDPAAPLSEGVDFYPADEPSRTGWRILLATMKPTEGWVGRNINRPISFRMSALLLRGDVSPNAVTWFTFCLAILMTMLLCLGGPLWLAVGGALYQAVSVIDCVDGDIARVTYRTSRSGAVLDTAFDMLANLGFVIGVMVGLVRTYGPGELRGAAAMFAVAALCMLLMTLLVRMGPRRGSFDVLRSALSMRLSSTPALQTLVLRVEKLFKRDFYALFAALLCVSGQAWLVPQLGLVGVCIWLGAILWCAPVIVADKAGQLLPPHLREAEPARTSA